MKSNLFFLILALSVIACKPVQYSESSPEIDTVKGMIQAYEEGNWETFKESYADTAQIYQNTVNPVSIDESVSAFQEEIAGLSEYGFDEDINYEFVITNDGEHWVGWWGVWRGKMTGWNQEFAIPVHVSAKFEDGKIVEEWGYWDNQPLAAAAAALQATAKAMTEQEESGGEEQ